MFAHVRACAEAGGEAGWSASPVDEDELRAWFRAYDVILDSGSVASLRDRI